MPEPELYVIYTQEQENKTRRNFFERRIFDGKDICIDVKVKMVYDGRDGDINITSMLYSLRYVMNRWKFMAGPGRLYRKQSGYARIKMY